MCIAHLAWSPAHDMLRSSCQGTLFSLLALFTDMPSCADFTERETSLIAHWSFDDETASFPTGRLPTVILSAWIRPIELRGFREILRQECDDRSLSSLRNYALSLSLKLDIDSYVECDAPVDAAKTLGGSWHRSAATFDGQMLREYVAAGEVEAFVSSGTVATADRPALDGGSLEGHSAFFQRGLDDLRVYTSVLSEPQIGQLHNTGKLSLAEQAQPMDCVVRDRYCHVNSFVATIAEVRPLIKSASSIMRPAQSIEPRSIFVSVPLQPTLFRMQ